VETALEAFYRFFKRYERVTGENFYALQAPGRREQGEFEPGNDPLLADVAALRTRFLEAMDDDFNTGGAIGDLFELLRRLNKFVDDEKLEKPEGRSPQKVASLKRGTSVLRELSAILGLFRQPQEEKAGGDDQLVGKLMALMIDLRAEARKKKDFATADRIRNGLKELGIVLEDRPGGTEWSVQ
jgi:cysteinyl-tRNA synthetase